MLSVGIGIAVKVNERVLCKIFTIVFSRVPVISSWMTPGPLTTRGHRPSVPVPDEPCVLSTLTQ